jgi:hypothetical protein
MKKIFLIILLVIPSLINAQSLGGLKLGMTVAQVKKVLPTYYFKVYEPDGNGSGDWRMQEQDITNLDIFKTSKNKTASFSIILTDKKASVIFCYDSQFKIDSIGIGNTLSDLKAKFPDVVIQNIAGAITGKTIKYPLIEFGFAATDEQLELDTSMLPSTLKVSSINLSNSSSN